ncbi:copper chaperone PCu(A)C [Streptomyces sp. MUM 203J]|uniref:copper chaperone PCu(A)C n=1 Tax=Streptomyces sp. MUM 203J TaxID=2791990 RepID=UPI001F036545|nr:copper chaperone PCu(A)C [Streptomyces sp. MUM 203J]MCH0538843.1 copper chaperone PCu(A)C [Streptomyces sp. MUM 203J]
MNRRTTVIFTSALALVGGLALGGCSSADASGGTAPELKVSGAFIPEPVNRDMAGGFLTLTNTGGADATLTSVSSDVSDDVQMHETKNQKMQQVQSFDVPANGELKLERGGSHLMFMALKRELKQGDKVRVELRFKDADAVTVEVPVEARTHNPAKAADAHQHH